LASRSSAFAIVACLALRADAGGEPVGAIVGKIALVKIAVGSAVDDYRHVVVYLEDAPGGEGMPKGPFAIAQHDKTFEPDLIVVPVGASVEFPNKDSFAHNVFSPASGTGFDLGLYKGGSSKSVTFDKAGVVPIFCNIHPQMIAHIVVVPNRFYARPAADGSFHFDGVPPGTYHAIAWFPFGRAERQEVVVAANKRAQLDFKLRERSGAERHANKEGKSYKPY
jgi:plastocyanin